MTAVHEMALPLEFGMRDVEVLLGHRRRLPTSVEVVLGTMDVPKAVELGLDAIGGDLAVDGSIGARTSALEAPYADRDERGALSFDDEVLEGFFHDGHGAGLQVGMHAIGDRAIEQVLRGLGVRPSPSRLTRAASLPRATSPDRAFRDANSGTDRAGRDARASPSRCNRRSTSNGGIPAACTSRRVGAARAFAMNPVRLLLDRGVVVGVGSDAPVVPIDPWLTVHALEHHHDPGQRLTRAGAIRLHTAGSARLAHQEEKKGMLEPGMHADFAAYDLDPMEVAGRAHAPTDDDRVARPGGVARLMSFLSHFLCGPA